MFWQNIAYTCTVPYLFINSGLMNELWILFTQKETQLDVTLTGFLFSYVLLPFSKYKI